MILAWPLVGVGSAFAAEWARVSPFTEVKCTADSATVRFQGRDYALVAINDQTVAQIFQFCRREYSERWEKRFVEDLVEVLAKMGHPMTGEKTVKLVLKNARTGEVTTIDRALLTEENRKALLGKTTRREPAPPAADAELPVALDAFERALREQWAYYKVGDADFTGAIRRLRGRLPGLDANSFGIELQKIIALGVDGHAGVDGYRLPGGGLPFLIEPSGSQLVAFKADRSDFLDPQHPCVTRLDGHAMSEWLRAASELVAKGSPSYVRRHSLRMLRSVEYLRRQLGVPGGGELVVELASADGASKKEVRQKIAERIPTYGTWPPPGSRLLEGKIGYLRIPAMDEKAVEEMRIWMPRFRETHGLVIDVRGNGGGSRDALRLLYSYLAQPAEAPRVVNVAAYRLASHFQANHLEVRHLFRENSPSWSAAEREAIAAFQKSFRPAWSPPAGEFSEWHYLVLTRLTEAGVFAYTQPVAVLLDEKCFSATDIFLAGLKGLPNVTLIGTPSGGGSARAVTVRLTESLGVNLGSMVSFQPDGRLFDGHGVTPDIVVEPEPEYFIGKKDNVLGRALSVLGRRD